MGLYEFTCMPFGLSNAGSSFCHLMQLCLRDQQFVNLLLYLDDICVLALTIDKMLDHIQLVFDRLKNSTLKLSLRSVNSLALVCCFWAMSYQLRAYQPTQKKVDKVKTWPVPKNIKEVQSFLGLASYYRHFILHFAKKA